MNSQQTYDDWFHQNIKDQLGSDIEYHWNNTGVDLISDTTSEEIVIQQVIDFFASVDVPHLREGSIRKMFDTYHFHTFTVAIERLLWLEQHLWISQIGENGKKIYAGIRDKFNNIPVHVFMGSLPFFGRGVGKRRFKKLEIALGSDRLRFLKFTTDDITNVDGFQDTTGNKIIDGVEDFERFMTLMPDYVVLSNMKQASGGTLDGHKICMSGFRDKDLQIAIESSGGTIQSGVSSKTTILVTNNTESNTGKVKKAKDLGIEIMNVDDFKRMMK